LLLPLPLSRSTLFPYTTLFRSWLGLLYLVAVALIAVGVFLNDNVKFAGWQLLGIVVVIHLIVSGVGSHLRGKKLLKLARAVSVLDRKSTRLNSSHDQISYAVFC